MSYLNRKKGQFTPKLRTIDFDFQDGEGVQTIPLIPISYATRQRLFTDRLEKNGADAKGNPLYAIDITGKAKNLNAEVIVATVADDKGKPAYTLEDLKEWEAQDIERLYTAISKECNLFGGTNIEDGETAENPPSGPTSSSGT